MNEDAKAVLKSIPIIAVIFGLAAYGAYFSVQSEPPPPAHAQTETQREDAPRQEHQGCQHAQEGTGTLAPSVNQNATFHCQVSAEAKDDRQGYTDPEWWIAGFTLLLAIVTGGLWRATWRMWQVTLTAVTDSAKGLELANKSYISRHRPKAVARGFYIYNRPDIPNKLCVIFSVYNKGESTASIEEIHFFTLIETEVARHSPRVTLENPSLPVNIESGFEHRMSAIMDIDRNEIEGEIKATQFRAVIIYYDQIDRRRQSSAHRSFNLETGTFSRIENSDFEYED